MRLFIKTMIIAMFNTYNKIVGRTRYCFYKLYLNHVGNNVTFYGYPKIYYPERISIGDGTTINHGVFIDGRGGVKIGKNVRLSPYVIIETGFLSGSQEPRMHAAKEIIIGDNAWVASGAIILGGVTIGRNATVAAGAVVTRDVQDGETVMGIPAKTRSFVKE